MVSTAWGRHFLVVAVPQFEPDFRGWLKTCIFKGYSGQQCIDSLMALMDVGFFVTATFVILNVIL